MKRQVIAGVLVGVIGVSLFGATASAAVKQPEFCSRKNLSPVGTFACSIYVTLTAQQKTLDKQAAQITVLEARVKALEATPKPTALPSPVVSATPIPTSTPTPSVSPSPSPVASSTCGGGYPDKWCKAPMDSIVDNWGMYNRENVSYAAFKVATSGRTMPYWGGRGNAKQWPGNAMAAGIPIDQSPRVGDVAISMDGPYGHAMYVEAVSGGMITVSQYNYSNNGTYSMMTVPASFADYFIHFR